MHQLIIGIQYYYLEGLNPPDHHKISITRGKKKGFSRHSFLEMLYDSSLQVNQTRYYFKLIILLLVFFNTLVICDLTFERS